jgi:type III pantothenate kinase
VLASKYFKVEPLIAGQAPVEWGVELDVAEPKDGGRRPVLNAIAAHAAHEGDLIVIDFGTRPPFDVDRLFRRL